MSTHKYIYIIERSSNYVKTIIGLKDKYDSRVFKFVDSISEVPDSPQQIILYSVREDDREFALIKQLESNRPDWLFIDIRTMPMAQKGVSGRRDPIYIFDLDDTLTIVGERKKYITDDAIESCDFEAFNSLCENDKPDPVFGSLFRLLRNFCFFVKIVTGRNEGANGETRSKTIRWLERYDLLPNNPDEDLYMRKWGDTEDVPEMKLRVFREYEKYRDIAVAFDDMPCILTKLKAHGYKTIDTKLFYCWRKVNEKE